MQIDAALSQFEDYLRIERRTTEHTRQGYLQDIHRFDTWLNDQQIRDWREVEAAHINAFIRQERRNGKARSTQARRLASLRAFFKYLHSKGMIATDPTHGAKLAAPTPMQSQTSMVWEIAEVNALLQSPDETQPMGVRDHAMLELLYASGMKVSELITLDLDDLNIVMSYVRSTSSRGRERHIPISNYTTEIMTRYCLVRTQLAASDETALFVNHHGRRLTRQGFWKIVKKAALDCRIDKPLTPHILRRSFAVHMLGNGADLKTVQELMGHVSPLSTHAYLPTQSKRLKDVYERTHPRAARSSEADN